MTKIEIKEMTKQEQDALMFNRHPEFKMIDETTATVSGFATIKFDYDVEDIDQVKTEQELAAAYCEQYTNEQIMQALALMDYKQEDDFDKLPKYVTEFEESLKSGEPMNFYDFIKNEDDLRDYLTEEWPDENIDEYLEKYGDDYVYSPLGALFLNRLY